MAFKLSQTNLDTTLKRSRLLWRALPSLSQQARVRPNSYFDFFIDSFHVGVEKPDPGIFLLATERAMVAPEQAAYVGDLYWVDVVGAHNAGLLPILYDPFELNRDADCLSIRSIDELLMLFR